MNTDGWLVEPSDVEELKSLLDLKPWQLDRLGYWLDRVKQFTRERESEIDRNARAYGWEVGNGKEAKDVIEASPDNPYLKENDGNQG